MYSIYTIQHQDEEGLILQRRRIGSIPKEKNRLGSILKENFVQIHDLYSQMAKMYYPCPQKYQVHGIISGKIGGTIKTYLKILAALNTLVADPYRLDEIIDPIDKEDLI
jgi:hypothetical protein